MATSKLPSMFKNIQEAKQSLDDTCTISSHPAKQTLASPVTHSESVKQTITSQTALLSSHNQPAIPIVSHEQPTSTTQTSSSPDTEMSLVELLAMNLQVSQPSKSITHDTNSPSSPISLTPMHISTEDTLVPLKEEFSKLDTEEQIQFLGELFQVVANSHNITVPADFISLSLRAMRQLRSSGRSNFLYGLSRGLGEQRVDGSDSIFPSKRLVSGLFEHCVNFFVDSKNVSILL